MSLALVLALSLATPQTQREQALDMLEVLSGVHPSPRAANRLDDRVDELRLTRAEQELGKGFEEENSLRDHAIATYALVMAWAWERQPEYYAAAQSFLNDLAFARTAGSGWAANEGAEPDAWTTGWALLALRQAERVDLTISARALTEGRAFQVSCLDPKSSLFAMRPGRDSEELEPSALALIGLMYEEEGMASADWGERCRDVLLARSSFQQVRLETRCLVSAVAFNTGGSTWKAWSAEIKPMVRGFGREEQTPWDVITISFYFRYATLLCP